MESARPASAGDLGALARLWQEAVVDLGGRRGGGLLAATLTRADLVSYLTGALSSPERILVVGLVDDVPVGIASARAFHDRREPVADLELIYVEPQARQIGVAEGMLNVVLARCADWGVAGVDAPALPGSRSAKSFFEIHGFQARLLIMHRPITPEDGPDLESGRG